MDLVLLAVDPADINDLPPEVGDRIAPDEWTVAYDEAGAWSAVRQGLPDVPHAELASLSLDEVVQRHPGGNVLVLARPTTVARWVADLIDVPVDGLTPAVTGSLTRIRASRRGHRNLISYSDTLHLAGARAAEPRKEAGCQTSMSS